MKLLNEEWFNKAEYETECGERWVLDYFIKAFEGEEGAEVYGLSVNKSTPEGLLCDSEDTGAISENRTSLLQMATAFVNGIVPPCTLVELADDWISEKECLAQS